MTTRVVAWRRADEDAGHSLARVERRPGGWLFHGTEVLAGPETLLACSFRVEVDDAWATRSVEVTAVSAAGERRLVLAAGDDRRWTRDGEPDPALDGCVDVDVAATPLTNTLPIRRLAGLAAGEEVVTPVAWVDVPALGVTRVDQTYRRLGERSWRYSDDAHGAFELTVDDDGLVVDYTGMSTRVAG
ncbi:putative glycolipid-binding domain-containing protein [Geodermatophilus sp. FMUSA9-8]|uniref:putative glycolipid-binding domain-containing protein n=1 Tax=Geodermatophilus sp. FMUSA9-8 TaxID=3120155 RepID=UPI00300B98DD